MSTADLGENPPSTPTGDGRFQILALSGGGYRGRFIADVLARIEPAQGDLRDHFDLIAGTSIGAVIAAALACGVRADAIRDALLRQGKKIFPRLGRLRRPFVAPYDPQRLRQAIVEVLGETRANQPMSGMDAPLLIPAVNDTMAAPALFRSAGLTRLPRGVTPQARQSGAQTQQASAVRLIDALLASAAAPSYFAARSIGHENYVDGGLVANAPDLVAVTEAMRWQQIPLDGIHVLSLGTAPASIARAPGKPSRAGTLGSVRRIVELTLAAQETLAVAQCSALLDRRHLRIDAVPSADQSRRIALDDAGDAATRTLGALARHAATSVRDSDGQELRDFLGHPARWRSERPQS